MTNLDSLKDYFKSDPNFLRMKALEKYFNSNNEIKELIHQKQHISKEIVTARAIGLKNTVEDYMKQYDLINQKISDTPFLDEYLDLLEYYHNLYLDIISYLENKINKGMRA